jgi:hypothetical protein
VSGSRAFCHGLFGVDLDVQIVLPTAAVISVGQYSVQRHLFVEQPGAGDFLAVLTPLRKGEPAPPVKLDPSKKMLEVNGPWGTESIKVGGVPETLCCSRNAC